MRLLVYSLPGFRLHHGIAESADWIFLHAEVFTVYIGNQTCRSEINLAFFVHKRLIDILRPSNKTVEALTSLELPAGVEIEIKL